MKKLLMLVTLVFLAVPTVFAAEQRVQVPLENSPTLGPDNAPITIFEFIDFQ